MEIFTKTSLYSNLGVNRDNRDVLVSVLRPTGSNTKYYLTLSISETARKKYLKGHEYFGLGIENDRLYLVHADCAHGYKISTPNKNKAGVGTLRFPITERMSKYQMSDFCGYYDLEYSTANGCWYIDKNHKII